MECAVEDDAGDEAPVLEGHVLDGLFLTQRGVVDQIVDAAEFFQRRLRHGLDRGRVGDVGDAGHRLAALAFDLLDDAFGLGAVAPHIDHDGTTAGGQFQRHGAPDAAAGAGDDGHAAGEFLFCHSVDPNPLHVIPGRSR